MLYFNIIIQRIFLTGLYIKVVKITSAVLLSRQLSQSLARNISKMATVANGKHNIADTVDSHEVGVKNLKLTNNPAKCSDSRVNFELNPWPDYIQRRLHLWEKYMNRYIICFLRY